MFVEREYRRHIAVFGNGEGFGLFVAIGGDEAALEDMGGSEIRAALEGPSETLYRCAVCPGKDGSGRGELGCHWRGILGTDLGTEGLCRWMEFS